MGQACFEQAPASPLQSVGILLMASFENYQGAVFADCYWQLLQTTRNAGRCLGALCQIHCSCALSFAEDLHCITCLPPHASGPQTFSARMHSHPPF